MKASLFRCKAWRCLVEHDTSDYSDGEANLVAENRCHDERCESPPRIVVVVQGAAHRVDRRSPLDRI
jgi:hypothetical protein